MEMTINIWMRLAWLTLILWGGAIGEAGQPRQDPGQQVPAGASETFLVENIKRLCQPQYRGLHGKSPLSAQVIVKEEALAYIDNLLRKYPESKYRDEALIAKLSSLADLARVKPEYLEKLIGLTAQVSAENPGDALQAENAFFAIHAFALGARAEKMPENRRIAGMKERYSAFLDDYPKSPRVPVVSASFIRNLIAINEVDRARSVFEALKKSHPQHSATKRAEGELFRASAVGKPFNLDVTISDGKTLRTKDYLGKVLILHFWATADQASREQIAELKEFEQKHGETGLSIVGVAVDREQSDVDAAIKSFEISWPQYHDGRGFENDILIAAGVTTIPCLFVADRQGKLVAIDPGEKLTEIVGGLLREASDGKPGH